MMLDHVSIGVSDLSSSIEFYNAALAPLGYACVWSNSDAAGYGRPGVTDEPFAIKRQRRAVTPIERLHIAFASPTTKAVRLFHAAALAQGAKDDGAPAIHKEYGPDYFAAFVIDPDGYRLEAVCHC